MTDEPRIDNSDTKDASINKAKVSNISTDRGPVRDI